MRRYWVNTSTRMSESESLLHDIVRSFLMLQVFLGHISYVALPTMGELLTRPVENALLIAFKTATRFGPQAAYLFVFLSGYLVFGGLLLSANSSALPTMKTFMAKRVQRLWPTMFAAVVVTCVLDAIAIHGLGGDFYYRSMYSYDMVDAAGFMEFFGNILFLQPTIVDSFGSNGPLWTLGYIVQYYVVGYLVVAAVCKGRSIGLMVLLLIVVPMAVYKIEWFLLFCVWVSGGVLRLFHTPKIGVRTAAWLALFVFAVSNLVPVWVSQLLAIFVGALFVVWSRVSGNQFGEWLRTAAHAGGRYGYAVYALHFPVILFIHYTIFDGVKLSLGQAVPYVFISVLAVGALAAIAVSLDDRLGAKARLA